MVLIIDMHLYIYVSSISFINNKKWKHACQITRQNLFKLGLSILIYFPEQTEGLKQKGSEFLNNKSR